MSKKDFVDKGLLGLRGKLQSKDERSEETPKIMTNSTHTSDSSEKIKKQKSQINKENKSDTNFAKALKKRKDEFLRTRQTVNKNIECLLSDIETKENYFNKLLKDLKKANSELKNYKEEINSIQEETWNNEDYSSELGESMKKVENARLHYIMLSEKFKNLECSEPNNNSNRNSKSNSILLDFLSLSGKQFFRIGMFFFLPLGIILLITAIIISFAIFISMGII